MPDFKASELNFDGGVVPSERFPHPPGPWDPIPVRNNPYDYMDQKTRQNLLGVLLDSLVKGPPKGQPQTSELSPLQALFYQFSGR